MEKIISRREIMTAGAATMGAAVLNAQSAKPLNFGIIGLGNRSGAHVGPLKKLQQETKIAALCDIRSDRMQKVNEGLAEKAEMYTDYRELIKDKRVSAVAIVTPGYLHHEMVLAALRAGKDVMVEKPMAVNYREAMDIVREAKRTGRIVCVGMQRSYTAGQRQVKEIVESGRIGQVRFINYAENRNDWNAGTWKYTDPATGKSTSWRNLTKTSGSSELEFSIHAFGFIYSIIQSPLVRLSATGGVLHYKDGRDTRDYSAAVAEYKNGIRLNYTFSCFAAAAPGGYTIAGDKGVIVRQGGRTTIGAERGKAEDLKFSDEKEEGAELQMYREFIQNVRERKQSPLNPEYALEPAKIAYGMEIAITQNRVVTAKDFA